MRSVHPSDPIAICSMRLRWCFSSVSESVKISRANCGRKIDRLCFLGKVRLGNGHKTGRYKPFCTIGRKDPSPDHRRPCLEAIAQTEVFELSSQQRLDVGGFIRGKEVRVEKGGYRRPWIAFLPVDVVWGGSLFSHRTHEVPDDRNTQPCARLPIRELTAPLSSLLSMASLVKQVAGDVVHGRGDDRDYQSWPQHLDLRRWNTS
jgi:hypothetical protein